MATPWYFGARNPWGVNPQSQYGSFNLGGIQTPVSGASNSVASPTAGASGSTPGRPMPQGGMAIGQRPGTPPDELGATGGAGAPAPSGPGMSVAEANAASQPGGLPGTFAGMAPNIDATQGFASGNPATSLGAAQGLMGVAMGANPATLANSVLGTLVNQFTGHIANNMGDPAIVGIDEPSIATGNPSASPPGTPAQGNVNTSIGRAIKAIIDANSPTGSTGGFAFGSNGSTIDANGVISNSVGARTGQSLSNTIPDSNTTQIPDAPPASGPTGETGLGPVGSGVPGGEAAAATGPVGDSGAPGTGGGGAGSGVGDGGGGGSAGTSGGAGVMKRGGRVQRPDPRTLAAKLRSGAKVNVGKDANVDSVPVKLAKGEFVVNRAATKQNEPELERINKSAGQARGKGGFAVGGR